MIAVFTTSVFDRTDADRIILFLLTQHKVKVTIDLQDEDKVMRIEGESFRKEEIIHHLDCLGFYCAELE